MNSSHSVRVYAGYRQFYLRDADRLSGSGDPSFWTEEAFRTRMPIAPGIVGAFTDTYGEVPVTLRVLDAAPALELAAFDHVVEGPLELSAGRAALEGCPDEPTGLVLTLPPGSCRVRISMMGLRPEPDETEYNGDSYIVEIWPAPAAERRVLKDWSGPSTEGSR